MKREEHIEHQVRIRVAEVLSNAGVGYDRISIEVLYMLPPAFVDAYIELYNAAFKDASSGGFGDENSIPVKRTKANQMPVTKGNGGKKHREHWLIRDDRAFARKKRVDRKLNKLIKEIRTGEANEQRMERCNGCGRWADERWRYCGWCGKQIRRVNENE